MGTLVKFNKTHSLTSYKKRSVRSKTRQNIFMHKVLSLKHFKCACLSNQYNKCYYFLPILVPGLSTAQNPIEASVTVYLQATWTFVLLDTWFLTFSDSKISSKALSYPIILNKCQSRYLRILYQGYRKSCLAFYQQQMHQIKYKGFKSTFL